MLLVEEPNHDNKPKAHFWEPKIIARTDDPFLVFPDRPSALRACGELRESRLAPPYAIPYGLLLEREIILA